MGQRKVLYFMQLFLHEVLALGMALTFYTSLTKELIVEKVRGLIPTFVKVKWEKLVGDFFPPLY